MDDLRIHRMLQAPNWTPDDKYLIYNADGLLYKYELANGNISQIHTGAINDLNNDHVLSLPTVLHLLTCTAGHWM
jgi:hypothetical protein